MSGDREVYDLEVMFEEIEGSPIPGDVAHLRSGGPLMTIDKIVESHDPSITCLWYADNGVYETRAFHMSSLIVYREVSHVSGEPDDVAGDA